jgi:hypothetical protein
MRPPSPFWQTPATESHGHDRERNARHEYAPPTGGGDQDEPSDERAGDGQMLA